MTIQIRCCSHILFSQLTDISSHPFPHCRVVVMLFLYPVSQYCIVFSLLSCTISYYLQGLPKIIYMLAGMHLFPMHTIS